MTDIGAIKYEREHSKALKLKSHIFRWSGKRWMLLCHNPRVMVDTSKLLDAAPSNICKACLAAREQR